MKAPVTIGDLRHRVLIETAARTGDGGGGAVLTWTAAAQVWAAIWTRTSDETFEADRIAGRATHDIWIRYRSDVKPEMRVRFGARVFDILGAIDVEDRQRWLKCPVVERDL
ncbi:MAG: phage head closure protein [Hyphomicrobium sp.]|nr:phage head closure protein [Hyphomicrobium sp.]